MKRATLIWTVLRVLVLAALLASPTSAVGSECRDGESGSCSDPGGCQMVCNDFCGMQGFCQPSEEPWCINGNTCACFCTVTVCC